MVINNQNKIQRCGNIDKCKSCNMCLVCSISPFCMIRQKPDNINNEEFSQLKSMFDLLVHQLDALNNKYTNIENILLKQDSSEIDTQDSQEDNFEQQIFSSEDSAALSVYQKPNKSYVQKKTLFGKTKWVEDKK